VAAAGPVEVVGQVVAGVGGGVGQPVFDQVEQVG
jgi:hypothetical protein